MAGQRIRNIRVSGLNQNTVRQTNQGRPLSENLMSQLIKGKEWATPGVEAALQRAMAGLDAVIESASPRVQTGLRRLADELAGGVETVSPRAHMGPKRAAPKGVPAATPSGPAKSRRTASGNAWLIAGGGGRRGDRGTRGLASFPASQ